MNNDIISLQDHITNYIPKGWNSSIDMNTHVPPVTIYDIILITERGTVPDKFNQPHYIEAIIQWLIQRKDNK